MCWLVIIINPGDSTIQNMKNQGLINTLHLYQPKLWVVPIFPQDRDRASKMRARVKITPREKGEIGWGEGDLIIFSLSPFGLAFLAWGDFHSRLRFAGSFTIPEEK